ncbi:unnamed protein product [Peniophora sp. CBMAI 1063]|nr:unnamed protein product [Peniophora sp. CBMAI 1063]
MPEQNPLTASIEPSVRDAEDVRARRRHNASILINTIPVEILAIIFRFLVVFAPPGQRAPGDLGWITRATHVCSHWREVALATPRLWSTPSFVLSQKWAHEMLARAKNAHLSLRLGGHFVWHSSWQVQFAVNIIRTRMDTIHHISLFLERGLLHTIDFFLHRPAPQLQEFVVDVSTPHIGSIERNPVMLSAALFASSAPRLRQIMLKSAFLPWDSPPFRDLERLSVEFDQSTFLGGDDETILERLEEAHPASISNTQLKKASALAQVISRDVFQGGSPVLSHTASAVYSTIEESDDDDTKSVIATPSFTEILGILRNSPFLRTLALIRSMPSRTTMPEEQHGAPIELLELEEISLEGHVLDCEAMLNTIMTPSLQSLAISCHWSCDDARICWPIISRIQRFLDQPNIRVAQNPVSHLVLSMIGEGYGVGVSVLLQFPEDRLQHVLDIELWRRSHQVYWDRTILISHIFSTLPLYTATVMSLDSNNDNDDGLAFPDWLAFAPYLPHMKIIRIPHSCLERAWRVLHTPELFPTLCAIVLCFPMGSVVPDDIEEDDKENFRRMQRVRYDAGCPPLAIVFKSGDPIPGI